MPHRQTTEDSATQFVYSIKFKLSHAIRYKTKGSTYLADLGIGQKAFDPLPLGHKGILGNSNQEKNFLLLVSAVKAVNLAHTPWKNLKSQ